MLGSIVAAFSESDDYLAALRKAGCVELLVTKGGVFRARMTRVTSRRLLLTAATEQATRMACISVPPGMIRVLLPPRVGTLVCGGISLAGDDIISHGSGGPIYERLTGPCRWQDIILSAADITQFSRALTGTTIAPSSSVRRWRPPPATLRNLMALHAAAMRVTETHPGTTQGTEAARGLEQQIIERLAECLSAGAPVMGGAKTDRHADIVARFDGLARAHPNRSPSIVEMCATLGVAHRTLLICCQEQLGISPGRYLRLRRMQSARRALRSQRSGATVAEVARQCGFAQLGRFAAEYRVLYGELPSKTLRWSARA